MPKVIEKKLHMRLSEHCGFMCGIYSCVGFRLIVSWLRLNWPLLHVGQSGGLGMIRHLPSFTPTSKALGGEFRSQGDI